MKKITEQVNNEAAALGMSIVDVKIRRADLPEANSQAVYMRMQTARTKEANDIRARGQEQAKIITSVADREAKIIIAEANKISEITRVKVTLSETVFMQNHTAKIQSFLSFIAQW